ncbi:MAG: hypothetical protein VX501_04960, partial [Pseudomonadota bacterium]|nr:hypothetical protein [Pseudomonadota bacterium]
MMVFSRRTFMLGAAGTVATMTSGNAEATATHSRARCRIRRSDVLGVSPNELWVSNNPLPISVQEIYPAALNRDIYVAGGFISSDGTLGITDRAFVRSHQIPGTDELVVGCGGPPWRETASLPEPRHHPNLVGHGEHIYAFGGFRAGNGGAWNMLANTTRY